MKRALIIIDPLNDFCPEGALAAPGGDQVMPMINDLMESGKYEPVVLVREEHPSNHISFASQHDEEPFTKKDLGDDEPQMLWPDHCVEGTEGAKVHPDLQLNLVNEVVIKGRRKDVENYSGFEDNDGVDTGLTQVLKGHGVAGIDVVGLATDYCVKETAIDGASEPRKFATRVLLQACRGIDANEGDVDAAIQQMEEAGVEIIEK